MTDDTPKPVEFPISKKVTAYVGYKDGHVGIGVKTGIPLVGEITLRIEAGEVGAVDKVIAAAKVWLSKTEKERQEKGVE